MFLQLLLCGEALLTRHTSIGTLARVCAHVAYHGGGVDGRVAAELAYQARCGLLGRLASCVVINKARAGWEEGEGKKEKRASVNCNELQHMVRLWC